MARAASRRGPRASRPSDLGRPPGVWGPAAQFCSGRNRRLDPSIGNAHGDVRRRLGGREPSFGRVPAGFLSAADTLVPRLVALDCRCSQGSIQGSVLSKSSPTEPELTPANTGDLAPPDPPWATS